MRCLKATSWYFPLSTKPFLGLEPSPSIYFDDDGSYLMASIHENISRLPIWWSDTEVFCDKMSFGIQNGQGFGFTLCIHYLGVVFWGNGYFLLFLYLIMRHDFFFKLYWIILFHLYIDDTNPPSERNYFSEQMSWKSWQKSWFAKNLVQHILACLARLPLWSW